MDEHPVQPYVEALQERGCLVTQHPDGRYSVTLPDGETIEPGDLAVHPHKPWNALIEACDRLNVTVAFGE